MGRDRAFMYGFVEKNWKTLKTRALSRTGFALHTAILTGSSALSQLMLLLTAPIITRLYTPSDLGIWAVFSSFTMTFAAVAALRYEVAIVLPETDGEAGNLVVLSLLIAAAMAALMLLLVSGFSREIAEFLGAASVARWLWYTPLIVLLTGVYEAGSHWAIRKKEFMRIAAAEVSQSTTNVGTQIGIGVLAGAGPLGLIVGEILGRIVAVAVLGIATLRSRAELSLGSFSRRSLQANLHRFRNFPLYVAPYSFIGSFSRRLLFLLLGIYASTNVLGLFSLAYGVVYAPIIIISSAMRRVFFQKAATRLRTGDVGPFVTDILVWLVLSATPILVLFLFNVRWIFDTVFGIAWSNASTYAAWLALPTFVLLLTAWLDKVYSILGKQRLALSMEIFYDILYMGLFSAALIWLGKAELAIAIYSVVTIIYNLVWLVITFRVARFSVGGLWQVGLIFLVVFIVAGAAHWATLILFQRVVAVMICITLVTAYYVCLSMKYSRGWRQIRS